MTTPIKIIGAIAVLGVILGGLALYLGKPTTQNVQTFGNTSIDGSQSNLPNPSNSDYAVARLALGLGTNLSVSGTGVGNVNIEAQSQTFIVGSSTICAIQNPSNATSTILNTYLSFTGAGLASTATFAEGTTTSAFATSSTMQTPGYTSGADALITWDPGLNNAAIGPKEWFTVGFTGTSATATSYAIVGSCGMVIQTP